MIKKAMMKYRNHPSVFTILDKYKNNSIFTFPHVTKKEVLKEVGNLATAKLSQNTDIPTKTIKQDSDIFCIFYMYSICMYYICVLYC